jgi:YVTN family beta-propeller protein
MAGNRNLGSRAFWARELAAFWAVLMLTMGFSARPAAGWHFAYVTTTPNLVQVIDSSTNTVVAKVTVGPDPYGLAVAPDGKHVYVVSISTNTVSIIDTATNAVVATVRVGIEPHFVAVAPDGQHAYVANAGDGTVSVIDTNTNTVVGSIRAGPSPVGIAITPDGKHAYVTNPPDKVSVIDIANNAVASTIGVAPVAVSIAITPDGTGAYVTGPGPIGFVSVIDTASNTGVATVTVGIDPLGVAIAPDGQHAYVTVDQFPASVAVLETATRTLVAKVPVGGTPSYVATFPPVPRAAFGALSAKIAIDLGHNAAAGSFVLLSEFTLGPTSNGIDPAADSVTLKLGSLTATFPPGSFKGAKWGPYYFDGMISGAALRAAFWITGTKRYGFFARSPDANLTGAANPVLVSLTIGDDTGTIPVNAKIYK